MEIAIKNKNIEDIISNICSLSNYNNNQVMVTLINKYGNYNVKVNNNIAKKYLWIGEKIITGLSSNSAKDYNESLYDIIYLKGINQEFTYFPKNNY